MRLLLGFVSSMLACGATTPPAFRLPETARPAHYELEVTIVPRQAEFRGRLRVTVNVLRRVESIWMNSRGLSIDSVSLDAPGAPKRPEFKVFDEFLELRTGPLTPGPAHIEIRWHAPLSDQVSDGLYRKKSGSDWYAYTTFTPIEARRAFPCFDEPGYKAPWRVVLHVPESDVAVSNSRMRSETAEPGGLKRVEFDETKPIASEVVALAVGPFDVVDAGTAGMRHIPVRILTPRGRGRDAGAARDATAQILARLEEYTGIPYPWDKLDHLAVLDMPYGAVENPGLITYRDRVLLAPPEQDTAERQRGMRGTMAHELAHQWFGNLVTQAWWDDVWLSEGFATWLGVKVSDLELPAFERGLAAGAGRAQMLRTDTGPRARPVRLAMNSRDQMAQVYSGIVYQKGAAILTMMEAWIGPGPFQRGLRRYLRSHAMANATTSDLEADLHAESGTDVAEVMDGFLDQTGFPVLRPYGRCGFEQAEPTLWQVPVCAHADGGAGRCELLGAVATDPPACPVWTWPNRGGTGYFRVQPTPPMLDAVVRAGWDQLGSAERLSIIEDIAAMAASGTLSSGLILKVMPVFVRDPQPAVASAAFRLLASLMLNAPPADRAQVDAGARRVLEGTRRGRTASRARRFAGTWEARLNDLPGVRLTIKDEGRLSGTILFYFQTRGADGKWHVAANQGPAMEILSPRIENGLLTFEVRHHLRHGGTEYGPNKRYSLELAGQGIRLRDRDDRSPGAGLLLTPAR